MVIMDVRAADLTFDVDVAGPADGRPVLLLHGFPESRHCWRQVVDVLVDAGYRCLVPDQRGYSPGARPDDVSAYALPYLAADALAITAALGAPIFDVVGHDWGGMVAWTLAARHPERVRSAVVVSTPHPAALARAMAADSDQRERSAYVQEFRRDGVEEGMLLDAGAPIRQRLRGAGLPAPIADEYAETMLEPGRLTGALSWYRALDADLAMATPPVRDVPTTYVWGDRDEALGAAAAESTRDHVSGAYTFVRLSGHGHWLPELAPRQLARVIIGQLRSS